MTIITAIVFLGLFALVFVGQSIIWNNMLAERKSKITDIVQSSISIMEHYHNLETNRSLSREQAQKLAMDNIRELRYGNGNYVFVFAMDGTALSYATNPELEGTNQLGMIDFNGTYIIKGLIDKIKADGKSTFHEYHISRAGSNDVLAKLSYGQYFEPWNVFSGTGVYLEDMNENLHTAIKQLAICSIIVTTLVLVLLTTIGHSLTKPITRITDAMKKLSSGVANMSIDELNRHDEIGKMNDSIIMFKKNIEERQEAEKQRAIKIEASNKKK